MSEKTCYNSETPIRELLPHRYPLLLVDKILDLTPYKFLLASKNITMNEPVFQGHFPDRPIYPGVYLIEGLAQASAILASISTNKEANFLLTQIKDARFKKQVIPGDCIHYEVSFDKKKGAFSWFTGTITVNSKTVATATLSAYMP